MTDPSTDPSNNPSMINVTLRMALEQAVERVIRLDPVVASRLQALDGQILHICASLPAFTLSVRFGEKPMFLAQYEDEPDCTLTGSSTELLRLALAKDPMAFLPQSDIILSGNSELLNTAAAIVREADFDWEGCIAQYTGGIVAHALGSVVRHGHKAASKTTATILTNLPEFIQEELQLLPATGEVEAFMDDLDQLRLATDRLQARVKKLTRNDSGSN